MSFVSAAAPLASYRAGDTEKAEALAQQVLRIDPHAAEAHMCLALISLRRNDAAAALNSLRKCAAVRSADWILERIRADFARHGAPSLARELAFKFGAFLRTQLSPMGAALTPEQRRSRHAYVNVVGTSYVRSFGGNTAFFPLFIGMGPTMLLLTEEAASLTYRKFRENLKRVDPTRTTLLVLGGDAYYLVRNRLKEKESAGLELTAEDFEIMSVVARRHAPMLASARKMLSGDVYMLGSTPTYNAAVDTLALRLNEELRPICDEHGIVLLDLWEAFVDPSTGHLRADLSAGAYPGDIHYSLASAPIFINEFKRRGHLPPDVTSEADFDWTSVFECQIEETERTRIWCEPSVSPNNAFKSDKIAWSHLSYRIADVITCLAAYAPERTLAIVNVRDGHTAIAVPQHVLAGCVAITDTPQNRDAAQMVLDYYGRTDVHLDVFNDQSLAAIANEPFWGLLLIIGPDAPEDDELRCNEVLARLGGVKLVMIATAYPDRVSRLNLEGRKTSGVFPISNNHIPEKWRNFTLFLAA